MQLLEENKYVEKVIEIVFNPVYISKFQENAAKPFYLYIVFLISSFTGHVASSVVASQAPVAESSCSTSPCLPVRWPVQLTVVSNVQGSWYCTAHTQGTFFEAPGLYCGSVAPHASSQAVESSPLFVGEIFT